MKTVTHTQSKTSWIYYVPLLAFIRGPKYTPSALSTQLLFLLKHVWIVL